MALRNQPYFPLYVQDYLTDEKLNECCAATQGIYIKILCLMHKSEPYGTILLKQKDKQASKLILNFAYKIGKHLLFTQGEIEIALIELLAENVLKIEGDILTQKRMIKDNSISLLRSKAGKKGGKKTQDKGDFASDFAKAKVKANHEDEYIGEIENVNVNVNEDEDEDIVRHWNVFANKHNLPIIKRLSDKRRSHIKQRLKEKDFDFLGILKKILDSDFLVGKNDRGWKVDFDFIFGSNDNYIKILEGKYNGRERKKAIPRGTVDTDLIAKELNKYKSKT